MARLKLSQLADFEGAGNVDVVAVLNQQVTPVETRTAKFLTLVVSDDTERWVRVTLWNQTSVVFKPGQLLNFREFQIRRYQNILGLSSTSMSRIVPVVAPDASLMAWSRHVCFEPIPATFSEAFQSTGPFAELEPPSVADSIMTLPLLKQALAQGFHGTACVTCCISSVRFEHGKADELQDAVDLTALALKRLLELHANFTSVGLFVLSDLVLHLRSDWLITCCSVCNSPATLDSNDIGHCRKCVASLGYTSSLAWKFRAMNVELKHGTKTHFSFVSASPNLFMDATVDANAFGRLIGAFRLSFRSSMEFSNVSFAHSGDEALETIEKLAFLLEALLDSFRSAVPETKFQVALDISKPQQDQSGYTLLELNRTRITSCKRMQKH